MISEDEALLYDRQIRLWGAEAQKIIRTLKVLVIGARGVGSELAKNLILSGIKSLTLMDSENVEVDDLPSQFFIDRSCIGLNRAKSSIKGLQSLNAHVAVIADEDIPINKPISFFQQFNVVVMTNSTAPDIIAINEICRLYKIKFFYADAVSSFGFTFSDIKHDQEERDNKSVSFKVVYTLNATDIVKKSRKKEAVDICYLVFKVFLEFFTEYKRKPKYNTADEERLLKIKDNVLRNLKIPNFKLPIEYLRNEYEEFGPTCVIVGGFIAQDILQCFYYNNENSFKVYNPLTACATAHYFVSSYSVKKTLPTFTAGDNIELDDD